MLHTVEGIDTDLVTELLEIINQNSGEIITAELITGMFSNFFKTILGRYKKYLILNYKPDDVVCNIVFLNTKCRKLINDSEDSHMDIDSLYERLVQLSKLTYDPEAICDIRIYIRFKPRSPEEERMNPYNRGVYIDSRHLHIACEFWRMCLISACRLNSISVKGLLW